MKMVVWQFSNFKLSIDTEMTEGSKKNWHRSCLCDELYSYSAVFVQNHILFNPSAKSKVTLRVAT